MLRGVKLSFLLIVLALFSFSFVIAEEDASLVTCDAYYEGYKYNSETKECELHGVSGCVNPFKYKTKEECEKAKGPNIIKTDLDECMFKCKANFNDEVDRSPCIIQCKERYGLTNKGDIKHDKLKCLPCGDACAPYEFVIRADCLPSSYDFKCGVENDKCIILSIEGLEDEKKVELCHVPSGNKDNTKTINVGESAVEDHLDHGDYLGDCDDELFIEYENEELSENAGTTPDSALYFIDKFFDKFGDELKVREERIAEIKAMVESGDIEAARVALNHYKELANELETEVDPTKRDEALRSAAAIRNVMKEIQKKVPATERDEFIQDIMKRERKIATSAEIAHKINKLCRELSDLDPELFYETCKVGEEGPKWQKDLYRDLSDEQKKEAKKFAGIMKKCFRSSGEDCECSLIPFPEFSKTCSVAAPLATACEIEGDENACDELDEIEMPELPPHLQEIMDDLEEGMMHEKFDMHMPFECKEQGITSPEECGRIMIQTHAPEECREALLASDVRSEREGREICDKIMMEKHAPECAREGISDPEECREYMETTNMPEECKERGFRDFEECKDFMYNIENRDEICQQNRIHDYNDCERFIRDQAQGESYGDTHINFDCKGIQDAIERLECYDRASTGFGNFKEDFEEIKKRERECASKCHNEGGAWDFTNGDCKCHFFEHEYEKPLCDDCENVCEEKDGQRLTGTGCGPNGCECYYEDEEYYEDDSVTSTYTESECKDGCEQECGDQNTDCVDDKCVCLGYGENGPPTSDNEQEDSSEEEETGSEEDSSEEDSEDEEEESTGDESSGITGNVFLDYMDD